MLRYIKGLTLQDTGGVCGGVLWVELHYTELTLMCEAANFTGTAWVIYPEIILGSLEMQECHTLRKRTFKFPEKSKGTRAMDCRSCL